MLLFIHCLLFFRLFVGFCVWSLFSHTVECPFLFVYYYVLFCFCNHPAREERAGCFTFLVFTMSYRCYYYLPLPVVGWSVVCGCGISWPHSLAFLMVFTNIGVPLAKSKKSILLF